MQMALSLPTVPDPARLFNPPAAALLQPVQARRSGGGMTSRRPRLGPLTVPLPVGPHPGELDLGPIPTHTASVRPGPRIRAHGHVVYGASITGERTRYVGVTNDLHCRRQTHMRDPSKEWARTPGVKWRQLSWHRRRRDALDAETEAIALLNPVHNKVRPRYQPRLFRLP